MIELDTSNLIGGAVAIVATVLVIFILRRRHPDLMEAIRRQGF